MDVRAVSHSDEILEAFRAAKLRVLERIGLEAEGEAIRNLTENHSVNTGTLRNGVTHVVDEAESAVYIGTNVEYGVYVELGTGKYATGGGRPDPWVYQDDKGNWHHTHGQRAKPFLRPALAEHKDTYRNIIIDEYKNIPNEF